MRRTTITKIIAAVVFSALFIWVCIIEDTHIKQTNAKNEAAIEEIINTGNLDKLRVYKRYGAHDQRTTLEVRGCGYIFVTGEAGQYSNRYTFVPSDSNYIEETDGKAVLYIQYGD